MDAPACPEGRLGGPLTQKWSAVANRATGVRPTLTLSERAETPGQALWIVVCASQVTALRAR